MNHSWPVVIKSELFFPLTAGKPVSDLFLGQKVAFYFFFSSSNNFNCACLVSSTTKLLHCSRSHQKSYLESKVSVVKHQSCWWMKKPKWTWSTKCFKRDTEEKRQRRGKKKATNQQKQNKKPKKTSNRKQNQNNNNNKETQTNKKKNQRGKQKEIIFSSYIQEIFYPAYSWGFFLLSCKTWLSSATASTVSLNSLPHRMNSGN